jgi:fatty-acid desaturase
LEAAVLALDHDPFAVHWLDVSGGADAVRGRVVWDPAPSIWQSAMALVMLTAGPFSLNWASAMVFLATTGATLLVGHSVGFHRRLIHRSFQARPWLDNALMWLGTLVGMSGPLGMMRAHDVRDWGQRQAACHPYLANQASVWQDYWWCVHCRLELEHPPVFAPGAAGQNRFIRFLEQTWMLQQAPLALVLFMLGGWPWVVWGVCARIAVSVSGHWYIGRLAHRQGPQSWLVTDSGVQAHDVPWAAIPTMGEAWHNNHHAFPDSARLGLYPGQTDYGFAFIRFLEKAGLVWDVRTPRTLPPRTNLARVTSQCRPDG